MGGAVAELAGAPRIASTLVNEGGGFHVDGAGKIYVADSNNRRIQVFNAAGTLQWVAACGGPPPRC